MDYIRCIVRRDTSGFSKKFYPTFDLLLASGEVFLMQSQKMQIMTSTYFLLTMDKEVVDKKSPNVLGKLREPDHGNYNLFGKGDNPNTGKPLPQIRDQVGAFLIVKNLKEYFY